MKMKDMRDCYFIAAELIQIDLLHLLYNKDTAEMYNPNLLVKDANIRNGAEIIII